jgi:Sulfotransferase domain
MNTIIMVMGHQRSGTNALFDSIAAGGDCLPIPAVENGPIYDAFNLRPESEIGPLLRSEAKPILLKPVNETKRRSIEDILEEFRDYNVKTIYIYRNPVQVFASQIHIWPEFDYVDGFIEQWNRRNKLALEVNPQWSNRFAIVSYEDLIDNPQVFTRACEFLGVRGKYLFRKDRHLGENLPPETQKKITEGTKEMWEALQANRTFTADRSALSARKIYANFRFFVKSHLPPSIVTLVRKLR